MKKLSSLIGALLGILSLEFLFGMIANLYVEFPDTTDQQALIDASWKHWPVATHMILALGILLLALTVAILGLRTKQKAISAMSMIGFLSLVAAALGGDRFVRTQHEAWSLTMAIGFIVAMGVYGRLMALVQSKSAGMMQPTQKE